MSASISVGDDNSYEVSVPAEPVRFHQGNKHLNNHQCCSTDIDFQSASWRRAIGQLNNEESAWLYYCYGCKRLYIQQ
ncbi:bacteriophage antitermination protein Q (plasmid) [Escherichia coli]|nr:bacteriophage antitermination protein Q [Escherichia coli]